MAHADPKRDAELAIARLKTRKEMRSADLEEDSTVIEQKAHARREDSVPAPARGVRAVLELIPPGQRGWVLVLLAIIATVAAAGGAKLVGWF